MKKFYFLFTLIAALAFSASANSVETKALAAKADAEPIFTTTGKATAPGIFEGEVDVTIEMYEGKTVLRNFCGTNFGVVFEHGDATEGVNPTAAFGIDGEGTVSPAVFVNDRYQVGTGMYPYGLMYFLLEGEEQNTVVTIDENHGGSIKCTGATWRHLLKMTEAAADYTVTWEGSEDPKPELLGTYPACMDGSLFELPEEYIVFGGTNCTVEHYSDNTVIVRGYNGNATDGLKLFLSEADEEGLGYYTKVEAYEGETKVEITHVTDDPNMADYYIIPIKNDNYDRFIFGCADGSYAINDEMRLLISPCCFLLAEGDPIPTDYEEGIYFCCDWNRSTPGGWTSLGNGKYTEDIVASVIDLGGNYEMTVEIEESATTPGLYRVKNPYALLPDLCGYGVFDIDGNHHMIVHAENPNQVYFETFNTGYANTQNYGECTAICNAYEALQAGKTSEEVAALGLYGTLANGAITFPLNKLGLQMANVNGTFTANANKCFRILLPGAKDYRVVANPPACAEDNEFTVFLSYSSDVKSLRYTLLEGEVAATTEAFNEAFAASEAVEVVVSETGEKYFSFILEESINDGRYTMFVYGLDEGTDYVSATSTYIYKVTSNDEQWESLGKTTYNEVIVSGAYEYDPEQLQVEIQVNKNTPGFYRLVNPYADMNPRYQFFNRYAAHREDHYIFIHAEDPDAVYLEDSTIGVAFQYGGISVCSRSIKGAKDPKYNGKLENGRITFPQYGIVMAEQNRYQGQWTVSNNNGDFYVIIPDTGVNDVKADTKADNRIFNLQGIEVTNPTKGIYIKNGEKIVIRK